MADTLEFLVNLNAAFSGQSQLQQFSASLSQLQAKTQALQKTSANISAFQKQATKLQDLREKLNAARLKVKDFQTTLRQGGQVDPKLFTRAHQEAAKLQQQVIDNTKRLGEFRAQLSEAGINTNNLAAAQANLQAQTDRMTRAQERLSAAQSRYNSIKQSLSWNNAKGDIMASTAAVMAFKKPVQVNMDFEAAMARVKSVGFTNEDADMSQFEALRKQSIQLGADTQFTAVQAANAQENLIRAGMTPQDVINTMPALLNMSAAEGMDIATAASILAKTIGGMNLNADQSTRVADVLAYTSANSNTSIAELGEAMKVAAPVAASQNISLEQVSAYLGVLANKGFGGSEGGNALSSSIMRLSKLPTEAAQQLKTLGVATRTRDGKMRELPDIMIALNESMKKRNYGEVQQLEVMSKVFGMNYGKAMMAFMQGSVSGDSDKLEQGIKRDSSGRAAKMANVNLDTLQGQMTLLGSAWDGLMQKIGESLTPAVRQIVEWLAQAISKINQFIDNNKTLADIAMQAAGAFAGWKVISTSIKYLRTGYELMKAWKALRSAEAVAEGLSGATKAAKVFGLTLNTALGIVGLLAFAAVEIYAHWDELKAWFNDWVIPNVWEPLKGYIDDAIAYVLDKWNWLTDKLKALNPFNWELPSWLGGGKAGDQQAKNAQAALSGNLPGFAVGGVITKHSVVQVAENGPEAIIPLTNKSRGLTLLNQAAHALGATVYSTSQSSTGESSTTWLDIPQAINTINSFTHKGDSHNGIHSWLNRWPALGQSLSLWSFDHSSSDSGLSDSNYFIRDFTPRTDSTQQQRQPSSISPTINITVNSAPSENSDTLAARIADAVKNALAEALSLEERVSFA